MSGNITKRDIAWTRLREQMETSDIVHISDVEGGEVNYHTARRVLESATELGLLQKCDRDRTNVYIGDS